jgi:hypothetical protein
MARRFMGGFALSNLSQRLKSLLLTLVPLTASGFSAGVLGWINAIHYAVCLVVWAFSFRGLDHLRERLSKQWLFAQNVPVRYDRVLYLLGVHQ